MQALGPGSPSKVVAPSQNEGYYMRPFLFVNLSIVVAPSQNEGYYMFAKLQRDPDVVVAPSQNEGYYMPFLFHEHV